MTIVCILTTPNDELKRYSAGERWCFNCRKRFPHDNVLRGEMPPEDPAAFEEWMGTSAAYYGPSWRLECAGCGLDCTAFPGTQP